MSIDLSFLLLGWATIFMVALGKGAFGGGLAMLGVPLLSLQIAPVEAAIVVAPLVAFMDIFALRAFGQKTWSRPDLAWLLPGLAIGLAIGAALLAFVDPRIVALIIGGVTLGFAADYFLRGRRAGIVVRPPSPPLALAAGTVSGFTTFVAHAGGPPVAMYLLRRGLDKASFAGTTVAFFTVGNFLKLPPYLLLAWDRPATLIGAACLAPVVPIGVWAGKRLHDHLPQARLFFWCYAVMAAAGLKLLVDAVRSLA